MRRYGWPAARPSRRTRRTGRPLFGDDSEIKAWATRPDPKLGGSMLTDFLLVLLAVLATIPARPTDATPDFPDLTIKTRSTMAGDHKVITTWYFKGPRMRSDLRDPDSTS